MTSVFLDASVGGRDGHLGRLAAARGYSVKTVLEEGVQICVVASSVARQAPSVTTSKRAKRMMLPVTAKQLTTADVCAPPPPSPPPPPPPPLLTGFLSMRETIYYPCNALY
jgi:hypothetical protein